MLRERATTALLAAAAIGVAPATARTGTGSPPGPAPARQDADARAQTPPQGSRPVAAPVAAAASPAAAPVNDLRFMLRAVTFDQSHFLPADRLRAIAAPYLGRAVNRADLDAIVAAVNAIYDRRGLVTARAVLGDVGDGVARITLIEGRAGAITVEGNGRLPRATAIARTGLVAGATIDVEALRHRLALLNRGGDTQYRVALQPGEQFGLTDVRLSVTAPAANVVQLLADDYGYDSAGQWEGSAYYRRTGILGASDRFTGFFSGSAGLLSGTAAYDTPLLGPTSRVGLSYGRSRIDIIDGPYAGLASRGITRSVSLNAARPIASSERGLLVASVAAGISDVRNYQGGSFLGRTRTHRAGAGLAYSYAAPGTSLSLTVNGLWANAPTGARDAAGDFAVVSGVGSGERLFGRHAGLRLAGGWQVATASELPSDLLFQIGGPTTVRGYRQGELTGDGGYYLSAEAELFPLGDPAVLDLFAFADQGQIFSRFDTPKALSAVGIGAGGAVWRHVSLRVTAGLPLRRIDGEAKRVRVFGRLGLSF